MNVEKRLKYMVGKTWLFNAKDYTINDFTIIDEMVLLSTNLGFVKFSIDEAHKKFTEFIPVDKYEENKPVVINNSNTSIDIFRKKEVGTLIDDLINNIETVKGNKEYVQQANAVNKSITAITNLMKLGLEVKKLELKEGFQ